MNNWWYVVIGAAVICIAAIVLAIIWRHFDDWSEGPLYLGAVAILAGIFTVIIFLVCIICPVGVRAEYEQYKNKREYVMQVIDTMDSYQYANFGITETILDYNKWLEHAKACKIAYGNWSFYKDIPLEELDYIGVGK